MRIGRTKRRAHFEPLESRQMLAADVIISEMMAANQRTIRDGFGSSSDWLELQNLGDETADISGLHLTDDEDNLNKWTFPAGTTILPNQFLLVFASGFDTKDDSGFLHTNFGFDASGDYVALVSSDFQIVSDLTSGRNFPDQFADISYGVAANGKIGFLTNPTPGESNDSPIEDIGPRISAVTRNIEPISSEEALVVMARVTEQYAPIADVSLSYRVMYGDETTITMNDLGLSGDLLANDGIFSVTIPSGTAKDGEMLRWYVSANDTAGDLSRAPAFLDSSGSDQSPEYFGTIVQSHPIDTQLPIFEWYLRPGTEGAAASTSGTRASVYYGGEFYDNVFVRRRGGSSGSLAKKSFKFDFNTANDFRFREEFGRVREININTTYSNKDYIRQALAFEVYDHAGVPGSESFPIRVQRNGEFHSVAIFVEQPDADFLRREGLDPDGALYKMFNTFNSANGAEKKTREYESSADLADFARQIQRLSGEELRNYLFDNVNIPEVLNYLAATVIIQNNDQMAKNYFAYRDSNGTGEWSLYPWDLDLTFGLHFMSNDSILDDTIWADKDNFTTFAGVTIWPSHPFVGDQAHPANRSWNRLIDAIYQVPEFREMHLRRLRTLMDEMLQPPGTPAEELKFEKRLDEYADLIRNEAELDYQVWANPWGYGADLSLDEAIERMKTEYFAVRRKHLYETHSIDNLDPVPPNVVIPEFTQASYFVPANNDLGTSWTAVEFNDSTWNSGQTGIGFENTPRDFDPLINSRVKPIDTVEGGTSIYVRIPFNVEDVSTIEDLTLRMKYDDGFVAYLNGTEIIQANLRDSSPFGFDSRARGRSNLLGKEFEVFPISQHVELLRPGENVLAIHGMNSSATSNDMLILPELLDGKIVTSDIAGIPHAQPDDVVLQFGSDIEFDPDSGNQDEEYLVLTNPNNIAVEISGWKLSGSAHTTFPLGSVIPANSSLYLSPNVRAFRGRSVSPKGGEGLIVQSYEGHLSNTGDQIRLINPAGEIVAETSYVGGSVSSQQSLRISEINYNPYDAMLQFGELDTDNDSFEFVEIENAGDATVDLAGVRLVELDFEGDKQGIDFSFSTGSLGPGQRTVVVKNESAFESRYGTDVSTSGEFTGKLSNGGETLTLVDSNDDVIQQFRYNDAADWPPEADGDGATLELIDANGDHNSPENWRASYRFAGTPGEDAELNPNSVVINEILARTIAPSVDQIELFNTTSEPIDISKWYLSDGSNFFKFSIPEGTEIRGNGFVTFDERTLNFGFKGDERDDAWLVQPDETGRPLYLVDHVVFGPTEPEQSIGRLPDGIGEFMPLDEPSFGASNMGTRLGDLNSDSIIDARDIDLLCQEIRSGNGEATFDLNDDGAVDDNDLAHLVNEIIGTWFGDANLDGVFNSSDLVLIFRAGQYEDNIQGNSTWETGDWGCDGEFTTNDLVVAFQNGGYLAATRPVRLAEQAARANDRQFRHDSAVDSVR